MADFSIPDARFAQDAVQANNAGDTSVLFQKTVIDAISTSIGSKTKTTTVSFSGKSAPDVMATLQELKRKGYRVSQSGTNFTIEW